jgi:ribosomal protein S18 acetylase RimI-like enzyme
VVLTAFDQAWALLKMPIVPNSFKEKIPLEYSAIFQDPVSNELLDMQAKWVDTPEEWGSVYDASYPGEGGEIKAEIKHPADDTYNLGDRAIAHIGQNENPEQFSAFGTGVDEEYQRRGYATALYDMLARILHEQGNYKLTSSGPSGLNEMSRGLWGDKKTWPVRDDL